MNPVKTLAIVGSGYQPYLVAHSLLKSLPHGLTQILLVELNQEPQKQLLISSGGMREVHKQLGFSEPEFVRSTRAEINLGFDFNGFGQNGPQLFCDAQYGFNVSGKRFYYLFNKFCSRAKHEKFEDYCTSAKLARLGRFTPPSQNPKSVFAGVNYGYRLTARVYRDFLKQKLVDKRVKMLIAANVKIGDLRQNRINSIAVNNETYAVDFVVDLTGQRLVKSVYDTSGTSIDNSLLSNAITKTQQPSDVKRPFAEISKHKQKLIISGIYQNQKYITEYSAADEDPSYQPYQEGAFDSKPWVGNCVAMSSACLAREPILVDEPFWLQNCLEHLVNFWPRTQTMEFEAINYNAKVVAEMQRLTEMDNLLIYTAFERLDRLSSSMRHRLETYQKRGKVVYLEDEMMHEHQWPVLFSCLGFTPQEQDVSVLNLSSQEIELQLNKFKSVLAKAAAAAPKYSDFIKSIHR